jgi:hypothetical protein
LKVSPLPPFSLTSILGWFVGDFVYGKRHNPALDKTPTVTEKLLDHPQIGMALQPVPHY